MSAYEMAATVEFGLEAKQGLLDLRSETARLRLVTRLFRGAIKRLDFVERAQARARSNGKVHFGDERQPSSASTATDSLARGRGRRVGALVVAQRRVGAVAEQQRGASPRRRAAPPRAAR